MKIVDFRKHVANTIRPKFSRQEKFEQSSIRVWMFALYIKISDIHEWVCGDLHRFSDSKFDIKELVLERKIWVHTYQGRGPNIKIPSDLEVAPRYTLLITCNTLLKHCLVFTQFTLLLYSAQTVACMPKVRY